MSVSWYSISISLVSTDEKVYEGYFSVNNNTNLVIGFYETINGYTNFTNNTLIPTGTGSVYGSYLEFTTYNSGWALYNNVYLSQWYQFDWYGVIINSMSKYPTYNTFNLWATNIGDESINNIGIIGLNNAVKVSSYFVIKSIDNPSCFNTGTKILCLNNRLEDEYIPIEQLKKGDLVKSYKHGYRRIQFILKDIMINNPTNIEGCMYIMKKTQENELIDDLIITGTHSILVDDLGEYKEENCKLFGGINMIDDKYLLLACVSKNFIKLDSISLYTYYHFILENNNNNYERFGVWANGVLTETPNKDYFMKKING